MSEKAFKGLPVGSENYKDIMDNDLYYVDKTAYIKTVFKESSSVLLITRPRRFGKTLTLNTFAAFLKLNEQDPDDTGLQQRLFKDTEIIKDREFCREFMGKFPVISITLKDIYGDSFEDAYRMFADLVCTTANKYAYLLKSPALSVYEKKSFEKFLDEEYLCDASNSQKIKTFLSSLSRLLQKHFKRQICLLIDEYDVPLAKAQYYGYHQKMVTLMSLFLGILKTPPEDEYGSSVLKKVVLTGCLKVAKNDIFTGVNNFVANTVLSTDPDLSGLIGFTKEEVRQILQDYRLSSCAELVKENYDGYCFFDKEIFCPWDVMNFIKDNYKFKQQNQEEFIKAANYWNGSTSSTAVYEYLGYLSERDNERLQDLVDGKAVRVRINDSVNYDCLSKHDPDDFWSLLLHTGYLTAVKDGKLSADDEFLVKIPNHEVSKCFLDNIQKRFNDSLSGKGGRADKFAAYLLEADPQKASDLLFEILQSYVSLRDLATKAPKENYYHGLLNGILLNAQEIKELKSNQGSGDGYLDLSFKNKRETLAVIIEIKACKAGEDKLRILKTALIQIEKKNYAQPYLKDETITSVYGYGIVFSGRNCFIDMKKFK